MDDEGGHADLLGDQDMGFVGLLGSLEPDRDDYIAAMLLQQVGTGCSHVRERRRAIHKLLLSDIFSAESLQRCCRGQTKAHRAVSRSMTQWMALVNQGSDP